MIDNKQKAKKNLAGIIALENNAKTENILNKKLKLIAIWALFRSMIRDLSISNCLLNSLGTIFL